MVRSVRRRSAVERRAAQLGVFWIDGEPRLGTPSVFVTRLHVRYDNAHFPEDLVFQETGDRANFQGRYVLRHAFLGADTCTGSAEYRQAVVDWREREAEQLARLTGWDIGDVRKKMGDLSLRPEAAWWERLWK